MEVYVKILATICQTQIWTERNNVVWQEATKDLTRAAKSFWATCIRHLRAIATLEHRKVPLAIQEAMLFAFIGLFGHKPSGPPGIPGAIPGAIPGHPPKSPALK